MKSRSFRKQTLSYRRGDPSIHWETLQAMGRSSFRVELSESTIWEKARLQQVTTSFFQSFCIIQTWLQVRTSFEMTCCDFVQSFTCNGRMAPIKLSVEFPLLWLGDGTCHLLPLSPASHQASSPPLPLSNTGFTRSHR